MTRFGYHCSHEQFSPRALLGLVQRAESAGFQSAMCSDHFLPWSEDQGHSGFAWSWLGAALATTKLTFGVVTVPGGFRYHPAILAQAAATLAEMYPGRFWIAPGSGEALNEHIVGQKWPTKAERNARLREAIAIMRALWRGETVSQDGLVPVEEAKLYTRPAEPPMIVGAALTPPTAELMGGIADALVTTSQPRDQLARILEAFRRGGGEGKPVYLQVQLAFARDDETALGEAWEQWRFSMLPPPVLATLRLPSEFDAAVASIAKEKIRDRVRVSSDWRRHVEWLAEDAEMGFAEINLHNVVRSEQERFIDVFGEQVIPALTR